MELNRFLHRRKYELLLLALLQHLFIGLLLKDWPFYTLVIWPINMLILGIASVGVFIKKGKLKNFVRNVLFLLVLAFPIALPFSDHLPHFMSILNISYVVFFSFIFWEVVSFLIRPSYVNVDIISASACGYFLLIEINVFFLQYYFYRNHSSLTGIDTSSPALTFIDLVYFCSITLTSIGFGDITPASPHTKLVTSIFGIIGQFYSVVLVGILISKFSSIREKKSRS